MSIATELQRIVDTKKDLRKALKIDDSVPFSQYAAHIPWHGETPPANAIFFDFMNDRYSADGVPVALPALGSTFTRLSSATQWKEGALVDVAANVMRVDAGKGLLIEPQRTSAVSAPINTWNINGMTLTSTTLAGEFAVKLVNSTSAGVRYFRTRIDGLGLDNKISVMSFISKPDYPGSFMMMRVISSLGYQSYDYDNSVFGSALFFSASSTDKFFTKLESEVQVYPLGSPMPNVFGSIFTSDRAESSESAGASGIAGATVALMQFEEGVRATSYIRLSGSPTTRAKETFIVTLAPGQTITSDKDPGIVMTMLGNDAVFEGHGHLRYIWVD